MGNNLMQIFKDINRKYFKPILGKEVYDLPIKFDRSKFTGGKTWYKFNNTTDAYIPTKITISDYHNYTDQEIYGIIAHEMIHAWIGQHTLYNPKTNLIDRLDKGHGPSFTDIVKKFKTHGLIVPMQLDTAVASINQKYIKDSTIFIAYQTEKKSYLISRLNNKNKLDLINKLKRAFELYKNRYSKIIIGTVHDPIAQAAPELRTLKKITWMPISAEEYNLIKHKLKDIIYQQD